MNDRKEYFKKYREEHKEEIRKYKKEYAKTHDSSFKKLQIKNKDLQQRIDKVIEYVDLLIKQTNARCGFISYEQLLSILKGEDKEC